MKVLICAQKDAARKLKSQTAWNDAGFDKVITAYTEDYAGEEIRLEDPDLIVVSGDFGGGGIRFLQQQRKRNAGVALVYIGCVEERFLFRQLLRLQVLDVIEDPDDPVELKQMLDRYQNQQAQYRATLKEAEDGRYWQQNQQMIEEQFWKRLCLDRIPGNPEAIEQTARRMGVRFSKDVRYSLLLIVMKNQDEMWTKWGENDCQAAIQGIARTALRTDDDRSRVIIIYSRILVIFAEDSARNIDEICRAVIQRGAQELGAELFCYVGRPEFCEDLARNYQGLLTRSKDDVLRQQEIVHVTQLSQEENGKLVISDAWNDILLSSDPERLIDEIRRFLIAGARDGKLSEQKLRIFQQDMLQLFFNFMDQKGISAHELYDNTEIYKLYKTAIQSIDGMCQWAAACIRHVRSVVDERGRAARTSLSAEVKKYVKAHLQDPIRIEDIAGQVHLSPDYMSKIFRKETGHSIRSYIIRKRMEKAREMLEMTDASISDIAQESGFESASYFIRQFHRIYGVTPRQFRKGNGAAQ